VENFDKDFLPVLNSKREKKSLSSGDFVTAAGMVQESENWNRSTIARQLTFAGELKLWPTSRSDPRFARLPWLIYTSHSPYSYYCTD
jgi:hypothetical protein